MSFRKQQRLLLHLTLTFPVLQRKLKDSGIHQLTNQYHAYDYYCYYFNPKHHQEHLKPIKDGKIQEAKMNVNITEGRTIVTFEEIKTNTTFMETLCLCLNSLVI